ncbi:MAG: hypothetical protein UHO11_03790 [Treponema sp.]|nr:hypothetical protein [Treponema sp.]
MYNPILGEWLILSLLFLNCIRIFFIKYGKVDVLTVLAPVCVILSVLQIVAWGIYLYSAVILFISIFCFFTNFRACLRFKAGLLVDHYSAAFKIGEVMVLLLTLGVGALLVYFRPGNTRPSDYSAEIKKIRLSGDFTGGFSESLPFQLAQGEVILVQPADERNFNGQSIIVMADKSATAAEYMPLMLNFAGKGFKVFSGEFYARDMKWCHSGADFKFFRRSMLFHDRLFDLKQFEMQKQFFTFNIEKEFGAMLKLVKDETLRDDGTFEPVYLVGDWMSGIALPEFKADNADSVSGYALLTDFEEYQTPGFGFIQSTDPLLAYKMGLEKDLNFTAARTIAEKIEKQIPERKYALPEPAEDAASENEGLSEGSGTDRIDEISETAE